MSEHEDEDWEKTVSVGTHPGREPWVCSWWGDNMRLPGCWVGSLTNLLLTGVIVSRTVDGSDTKMKT